MHFLAACQLHQALKLSKTTLGAVQFPILGKYLHRMVPFFGDSQDLSFHFLHQWSYGKLVWQGGEKLVRKRGKNSVPKPLQMKLILREHLKEILLCYERIRRDSLCALAQGSLGFPESCFYSLCFLTPFHPYWSNYHIWSCSQVRCKECGWQKIWPLLCSGKMSRRV